MTRYELVPWHDPDGRETWAIRRVLAGPDYFGRVVVSWHPTRGAAESELRTLEETPVSEETGVTPLQAWAVAALAAHRLDVRHAWLLSLPLASDRREEERC